MQSALANHGARLQADVGLVISDSNKIVASFGVPDALSAGIVAELVSAIERRPDKSWIALVGGRAIQFAVTPILTPDPNGFAAFGFALDDNVARDTKQLTELEVSFFAANASGKYNLSASTLKPKQRDELQ